MSPQVTITHPDGSTDTIANSVGSRLTEAFGELYTLEIDVDRADLDGITLQRKRDDVDLDGVRAGRLTDVRRAGTVTTLVVDSFEWLAQNHEPTPGGDTQTGTNQDIINYLLGYVDDLSAGTIEQTATDLTFIFNHAYAAEGIRRVERNADGWVHYQDDKTVDFTQSGPGSDKSGSITLSAANGNVDGEIRIVERSRDADATHLKMVGGHEGEAQYVAHIVPSDDSSSYTNRVDYTNPDWSDGDPADWERYAIQDLVDQGTLEQEGLTLIDELRSAYVEVTATVIGESVDLGDTVTVVKPEVGLDRDLRIVRRKRVSENASVRYECTLSSRVKTREGASQKQARDIRQFNTAFQGSSVWGTVGPDSQPVDAGTNFYLPFFYPDVDYEHNCTLYIKGEPYRSYIGAGGHSHPLTADAVAEQGIFIDAESDPNTTWTQLDLTLSGTASISQPGVEFVVQTTTYLDDESGTRLWADANPVRYRLRNVDTGAVYPSDSHKRAQFNAGDDNESPAIHLMLRATEQTENQEYAFEYRADGATSGDVTLVNYLQWYVIDTATESAAAFDPGINVWDGTDQSPAHYPDQVDVVVNGNSQGVSLGDGTGPIETTVDLTNVPNQGAWNDLELTCGGPAWLQATLYFDTYRQIGSG